MKEQIRKVIDAMRERESGLWKSKIPKPMGAFAVALMLDGFATELEIAIGDVPVPRGRKVVSKTGGAS